MKRPKLPTNEEIAMLVMTGWVQRPYGKGDGNCEGCLTAGYCIVLKDDPHTVAFCMRQWRGINEFWRKQHDQRGS
jgi:hypothetical protein